VNPSSDARNAATHFYSLSIQHEFGGRYILEAGYLGNRAYHLFRFNERNPVVGGSRLNPAWASRGIWETGANSTYNAAFVRFDRRLARGLMFGVNYTFSAATDDGPGPPQDTQNYRLEHARSAIDRPQRLSAHFVWRVPVSDKVPSAWAHALGGWQIAGYTEWQSGEPFTVTTGVDSNRDGVLDPEVPTRMPDRPDWNPAGRLMLDPVTGNWRSFRTPLDGTGTFVVPKSIGNLGRNTFRGPSYANTSMSLLKEVTFREQLRLEVRASWTNFFNHRNFGPPVAQMNQPDFGTNQSNPESRIGTVALRLMF
jgi:hypothetical protein